MQAHDLDADCGHQVQSSATCNMHDSKKALMNLGVMHKLGKFNKWQSHSWTRPSSIDLSRAARRKSRVMMQLVSISVDKFQNWTQLELKWVNQYQIDETNDLCLSNFCVWVYFYINSCRCRVGVARVLCLFVWASLHSTRKTLGRVQLLEYNTNCQLV
jgi:hypothetical protein